MVSIHDNVLDDGLQELTDHGETLHICSSEPTNYTEADATYDLGNKGTPSISAPQDLAAGGRKVTVSAISDGSVTASGTANYWAIVDDSNSKLLAVGDLASGVAVVNGNSFALTSFDISIPDPT